VQTPSVIPVLVGPRATTDANDTATTDATCTATSDANGTAAPLPTGIGAPWLACSKRDA